MKKYISIFAAALVIAASCTEGDRFDPNKDVLLVSGTDYSPLTSLVVDAPGATYPVSVSATGKVSDNVKVTVKIDNAALDKYNKEHGTNYVMVPASALAIDGQATLTANLEIEKGNASSKSVDVTVTDNEFFESGMVYAIPVTITDVKGNLEVLESSRTMIIKIARVIIFKAFDVSEPDMSSNFRWEPGQGIPLTEYTYEIKFKTPNLLSSSGDNPVRLCAFETYEESRAMLLRFNEASNDASENKRTCRRLQVITPGDATIITNTKFEDNKWYMLTLTFDGSKVSFYVNGELDGSAAANKTEGFEFGRFEMGMSWGGGYRRSQRFIGQICEMRVWSRAISATEVKEGLCGVSANAEGLEGYWKFDEGEGHIFHDSTKNGRDMDWSQTSRDNGNGSMTPTPEAGEMADGRWVDDPENNRCNA